MADKHITSVETTLATFDADAEHGLRAILDDTGEIWDECWSWINQTADRTVVGAPQYYSEDGSTIAGYYDVHFADVTAHDDFLADEYIKRRSGTDDYLRFQDATLTAVLTGTTALTLAEAAGSITATVNGDLLVTDPNDLGVGVASPAVKVHVFANGNGDVARFFGANDDGYRATISVTDDSAACFYARDENDGGAAAYALTVLGTAFAQRSEAVSVNGERYTAGFGIDTLPITTSGFRQWWVGPTCMIFGHGTAAASNQSGFFCNAQFDGTNYKYVVTDEACRFRQANGSHLFQSAASGTAGTNITFSDVLEATLTGVTLGGGAAGTDFILQWDGADSDFYAQHMEDEDELRLANASSATDYCAIEGDGTIRFAGAATVWKDANLGSAQLDTPPSSAPDQVSFVDSTGTDTNITTLGFAPTEYVSGCIEIQHDYKEGSDIYFHVHWQGITAPTGTDKVQWQLEYSIAPTDTVFPATTTITIETDFDTQYESVLSSFAAITGTNIDIGDQFCFKLTRIAASTDEYGGDALIQTAGLHYECDTVGSRTISAK